MPKGYWQIEKQLQKYYYITQYGPWYLITLRGKKKNIF